MSLRRRLLLSLGLSFAVLWTAAALWLYSDLRQQMRTTLDQRLASSARMVAGLVAQLPESAWAQTGEPILSMPQSAGVACQINAPSGQVLMRTHGEFAGQLDSPPPGFTDRVVHGERWRIFTYVQHGLHITTADRLAERVTLQRNVVLVAAVPFVVALLGSLLVLWFGLRRGLRPLERLRHELSQRAPDTLTPVEVTRAPAELVPAIETLNRLLARTRDALAREQRFTSDAAHELRTPLTAIKTHVQLAARLDPAGARGALVDAESGIARLQRTLEQLLLLSRVETGDAALAAESACIDEIATEALADLPDRARVQGVDAMASLRVAVPQTLAAAALRNLLQNALRHTPADQPIELDLNILPTQTVFVVRDRGDWPCERSTQDLTRRFWRGPAGRGQAVGSGLGLTIVSAIAERFSGGLSFEARKQGGLIASLWLPRADAETPDTHPRNQRA